ncbi:MAG: Nramp family divalent metal transporter [Planctomycetaceae bacterium]|nr:Nramp family divalent metal transporter [Planctomycetaceae bacterium]
MTSATPDDLDTLPPELDPATGTGTLEPPRTWWGTLLMLGPGLVIAGSIVGSGELIATTKTGAQAGISLLWLIVIGCLIKVFVQIELGRHTITHGETTLSALNQVPGRIGPVNWVVWFWLAMMAASLAQLGGIVGGVGQSLALVCPLTGDYKNAIVVPSHTEVTWLIQWQDDRANGGEEFQQLTAERQQRVQIGVDRLEEQLRRLGDRGTQAIETVRNGGTLNDPWTWDDRYWALAIGVFTVLLLYNGRYGVIQNISTALVVLFTFITIGNVIALQSTQQWSLSAADFMRGFAFRLPPGKDPWTPLTTALATFGIIGVGATELITYPYWCIEKGYARFTGQRNDSDVWADRARGWLRVMHYDVFLSMIVYTIATIAFFLMGVAVLYREGRDPEGMRMVSTLASAYAPVFGAYAEVLFLLGAVAVLYSTFLVANAGHARMFTDAAKVFGILPKHDQKAHDRTLSGLCIFLPMLCVVSHWSGVNPVKAVLLAGMMQAAMLPMIAIGAMYHRKYTSDPRLAPGRWWDVLLMLSFLGLLVAGVWGAWGKIVEISNMLMG